ncbi:MAG: hypothetical protein QW775_06780 [Ignisphaera sp.]|uniref:Uncharacterized protein n=1 Tax=Ignisphaera aggregans TaxID=334771 RepID=A0A7C4NK07_9CREN
MLVPFRRLLHKAIPKSTAIGYTLSGKFSKHVKDIVSDRDIFYDTYAMIYGFSRSRTYTALRTIYLNVPYGRGYVYLYGATLTQTPITLFLNLDSKCIRRNIIENAIELMSEGACSLYLAIPFTNDSFSQLYRNRIYRLFKNLGVGLELLHPSYTLVVGKSRVFKDSPSTIWSTEILAATLIELTVGRNRVKVEDIGCVDVIPSAMQGVESIYAERLAIDFINMLISRKIIDEEQAKEYLEMVKSS